MKRMTKRQLRKLDKKMNPKKSKFRVVNNILIFISCYRTRIMKSTKFEIVKYLPKDIKDSIHHAKIFIEVFDE